MTEGTITALTWESDLGFILDFRSIPGLWCEVVTGLDDLPRLRTSDDVVPFLPGRLRRAPMADTRPVVVEGQLIPFSGEDYAPIVRRVQRALDPFGMGRGTLTATLEDGGVLTIQGTAASIVYGEPLRLMPRVSIELDADPYWRGPDWGDAWTFDMGLLFDDGWSFDMATGPVTLAPTSDPDSVTFGALGTTATLDAVIEVDGPSADVVYVTNADGIGFGYPALLDGQTLTIDAGARTAHVNGVSARFALTLLAPNPRGEFFRIRAGVETVTVEGQPAEVRIVFRPSYL